MINSWDVLETALALHLLLLSANTIYLVNKWSPHQTDSQATINMHSCILSKPQEMDRQRGVTHLLYIPVQIYHRFSLLFYNKSWLAYLAYVSIKRKTDQLAKLDYLFIYRLESG
jgi:hypothetical protein